MGLGRGRVTARPSSGDGTPTAVVGLLIVWFVRGASVGHAPQGGFLHPHTTLFQAPLHSRALVQDADSFVDACTHTPVSTYEGLWSQSRGFKGCRCNTLRRRCTSVNIPRREIPPLKWQRPPYAPVVPVPRARANPHATFLAGNPAPGLLRAFTVLGIVPLCPFKGRTLTLTLMILAGYRLVCEHIRCASCGMLVGGSVPGDRQEN